MIDWDKINKDIRDALTPEERAQRDKYDRLVEENTFFETPLVCETHYAGVIGPESVSVIRNVSYTETDVVVDPEYTLAFGKPNNFRLHKEMIDWMCGDDHDGWSLDSQNGVKVPKKTLQLIGKLIKELNLEGLKDA